jgi:hypothetical protein
MSALNDIAAALQAIRKALERPAGSRQWLSLAGVAREYADISERKLRQFIGHHEHPLSVRRVDGKLLAHRDDLDTWLRGVPRASEDIDDLMALRHLKATRGKLPGTATATTGKGLHLYFLHPGGPIRNNAGTIAKHVV